MSLPSTAAARQCARERRGAVGAIVSIIAALVATSTASIPSPPSPPARWFTRRSRAAESGSSSASVEATRLAPPSCGCGVCRRQWLAAATATVGGGAVAMSMHKAQEAWPLLSAEGQKMLVWQMRGMGDYERRVRPRKTRLFEFALGSSLRPPASSPTGRVVEIGVGTGTNFPFMAAGGVREVIAVEPNPYFEPLAQEAAEKAGIALQVQQGRAEQMPFETGSVDTVVATLVMCSVDDVRAALSEIHRVLHPGGRYIFTEHVAAKDGSILRAAQEAANPLQMSTAAGCRLTRDPLEDIQRVFVAPNVHTERWTLLDETSESLAPHFLLSPHLSGFATRQ